VLWKTKSTSHSPVANKITNYLADIHTNIIPLVVPSRHDVHDTTKALLYGELDTEQDSHHTGISPSVNSRSTPDGRKPKYLCEQPPNQKNRSGNLGVSEILTVGETLILSSEGLPEVEETLSRWIVSTSGLLQPYNRIWRLFLVSLFVGITDATSDHVSLPNDGMKSSALHFPINGLVFLPVAASMVRITRASVEKRIKQGQPKSPSYFVVIVGIGLSLFVLQDVQLDTR
jgi:hypothetical protein